MASASPEKGPSLKGSRRSTLAQIQIGDEKDKSKTPMKKRRSDYGLVLPVLPTSRAAKEEGGVIIPKYSPKNPTTTRRFCLTATDADHDSTRCTSAKSETEANWGRTKTKSKTAAPWLAEDPLLLSAAHARTLRNRRGTYAALTENDIVKLLVRRRRKARGSLTTPTREPFKQSLKSKMKSVVKRIIYIIRWERAYEEHRISMMKGELKGAGAARHVEHKSVLSRLLKLSLTVQPANRTPQLVSMLRPYVSRLKCCETLNSTVRSQLPTIVEYECFGKGRTIVKQGHPGESYYLIVSGSVDVVIDGEGGHSKYVNELTTGQGFGEVALVNKGPRTASIITREPTELLRIDRTQFHEVLRASKLQEMARKQGFLRTHPCFHELPEEILKKFVDNALIKSYKASDMIIRSGDDKLDHVIIVMSGECHVETPVMLNYYKLNGGRFLLDLPTVKRPDISRIRSQVSCSSDSSSRITCSTSTMSDHPAAVLSTQSLSPYGKYFQNDVEEVSQKKYHLCLRRIKAREYFSASDCISKNGCNVGSIKKTECLLLPKILFQKHNMSKMLEDMTEIEEVNTLTVEEAFDSFLKRRHWEIYKKNLVSDVMKAKATKHKQSSVANSYSYR